MLLQVTGKIRPCAKRFIQREVPKEKAERKTSWKVSLCFHDFTYLWARLPERGAKNVGLVGMRMQDFLNTIRTYRYCSGCCCCCCAALCALAVVVSYAAAAATKKCTIHSTYGNNNTCTSVWVCGHVLLKEEEKGCDLCSFCCVGGIGPDLAGRTQFLLLSLSLLSPLPL